MWKSCCVRLTLILNHIIEVFFVLLFITFRVFSAQARPTLQRLCCTPWIIRSYALMQPLSAFAMVHFSVASCARHNTNPQSAILVGQFVIFNDVWNCNNWHESNQFTTVRLRQLRVRKMSFYIDIAVIYVFNTQHFIMYFGMSIDKSELLPMLDMMLAENYYTIIMWRWKKIEVCLWKMQLAVMNSLVFLSSLF